MLFDFVTPWGVALKGSAREHTIDRDTLISCIDEDEYRVAKLPDNGIAIDVGSYIGSCSLALAAKGYTVYAVEPIPENNVVARENIQLNGFGDTIHIYERALTANPNAFVSCYYGDTNTEIGKVQEFVATTVPRGTFNPAVKDGRSITVPTITLQEIFDTNKIEKCQFLKIDMEGEEWDIFEHISPALLDRIERIAIEIDAPISNPTSTTKFMKLLQGKFVDYSPTYFPDWSAPGTLVHAYYINKKL